jgi:two-component system phosphate regulon sensor histidine kinase PhoR
MAFSDSRSSDVIESEAAQIVRLQAEVAELKAELKAGNKSSQQYLQNVAHQLTAPLGAIKWSIEGLRDSEVTLARKMKLLSSIYSQATILVHLIKNFALMSNLEADHELGQFRDKPEPVDILRLAINLTNDFQPQAAETEKKISINESSFKQALGEKSLSMVKNLVAQALSNLLENAIKYADIRTTISISAERLRLSPDAPERIGISVLSVGMPITPEEGSRLFERGFRGNAAKQRVPAGTGIGLYLAQRVMTLHQGTITVRANGKETRFILVFPLNRLTLAKPPRVTS